MAELASDESLWCVGLQKNNIFQAKRVIFHPVKVPPSNNMHMDITSPLKCQQDKNGKRQNLDAGSFCLGFDLPIHRLSSIIARVRYEKRFSQFGDQ